MESVLGNVRLLLGRIDKDPVPDLHSLAVWPEGLDRGHLADMSLATRTRNCLLEAELFSGTAAVTVLDLMLPNFGPRSLRELLVEVERFLGAMLDHPDAYVPAAASAQGPAPAGEPGRRAVSVGGTAPAERGSSSGLGPVADARARVNAVVAAMSPALRIVAASRVLEEPQAGLGAVAKRLGVPRARVRELEAVVHRRVRLAVARDVPLAASILKRRLGHVVGEGVLRRHLDTALGGGDVLADRLLRKALVERMGYVPAGAADVDDEARAVIETLREYAREHADDAGLVEESELLALLPGRGWRGDWQFLLGAAGLHPMHGRLAMRRNGKARAKAALLSIGRPATRAEVADVCGLSVARTGACLSELRSVVRAGKEHWALDAWVERAYESIPREIVRRILEDGGATAAERLLADLPVRFGVRRDSVGKYLNTTRFVVRDGRVGLADVGSIKLRTLEAAAHGHDADGAPYWIFRVDRRHLKGFSVTGLPPEFAKALGCEPQRGTRVRVDNLRICGELSVHWRLSSTSGASLGRVGDALRALGIGPGEFVRVSLKGADVVRLAADGGTGRG